jgi:CMP-N-acetylneuraminic acid synthetase
LDQDETLGIQIYQAFAEAMPSDIYVLCHATSPFISPKTIDTCVNKVLREGHDSSYTVQRHQVFAVTHENEPLNFEQGKPLPRTQDLVPVFTMTSGVFVFTRDVLQRGSRIGFNPALVEVPYPETIDIDNYPDYVGARVYLETQRALTHEATRP